MGMPYLRLMGFLATACGIPPREFWRMTPREMKALVDAVHGSAWTVGSMRRADLEDLMERYPDRRREDA